MSFFLRHCGGLGRLFREQRLRHGVDAPVELLFSGASRQLLVHDLPSIPNPRPPSLAPPWHGQHGGSSTSFHWPWPVTRESLQIPPQRRDRITEQEECSPFLSVEQGGAAMVLSRLHLSNTMEEKEAVPHLHTVTFTEAPGPRQPVPSGNDTNGSVWLNAASYSRLLALARPVFALIFTPMVLSFGDTSLGRDSAGSADPANTAILGTNSMIHATIKPSDRGCRCQPTHFP
ncbi:hypothetical protein CONLIGDRAFT_701287 [Coniochaeta ligniaria NRRL 30616]|uniref:Uncharacterized protein n=1 Tax=Coniochaeta ligniaria NRRL 30616 TaxID=1408157 RepID=A0A1J7IXB4_9PEZI|nr:hypothetical protein CONLIGDRAFT_701287 [Coniochaeta ligniaria NRRL 30616]